jgi:hypothetical protein
VSGRDSNRLLEEDPRSLFSLQIPWEVFQPTLSVDDLYG